MNRLAFVSVLFLSCVAFGAPSAFAWPALVKADVDADTSIDVKMDKPSAVIAPVFAPVINFGTYNAVPTSTNRPVETAVKPTACECTCKASCGPSDQLWGQWHDFENEGKRPALNPVFGGNIGIVQSGTFQMSFS